MKRRILPFLLLAALLLSGFGNRTDEINSLADMEDMSLTIGLPDDVDFRKQLQEMCPKAQIVAQNDVLYGVRSVAEGKIDAFVVGRYYLEKSIREAGIKNVKILDEPIHVYPCGLGLSGLCKIPNYESTVNETVQRLIADGTINAMKEYWFQQNGEKLPEIKLDENPTHMLNAVTYGQSKPYSFIVDGNLTGFDVELLYRICAENHWGLNLSHADYPGMLMGLSTGKYDMISANLYITGSRDENISFSVPYTEEEISVLVYAAAGSEASQTQQLEFSTLAELKTAKSFAIQSGTIFDNIVKEKYPQAEIQYYPSVSDCALAMANGKVDATIFDAPTLKYLAACTEGVALIPEYVSTEDYYFVLPKSERGEALQKEFNAWLAEQKQNGEADRLYDFWCGKEEPSACPDFASLPNVNGKLRLITSAAGRPDAYSFENGMTGYPIELIYNFCRDGGYGAEMSNMNFDGAISCIASGKADLFTTFLSYTEERAQSVLFTDSIAEGGVGVLVRTKESETKDSFIDRFVAGLRKTFVTENRWMLIVSGLGITLLITLGGFVLANILGAAFCACNMSKRKALRAIADGYDRIMQGTPMVVVLMILYYVVFGKSHISGVWVAILAFGLASGASLARQFTGAIQGVDRGQTEAALSIGFTKFEAFTGIVFPQATRIALPGYFSEIIGLMKGTAIVGYIAVTDLTKAGDLIRSSTYDAFYPLLSVAVIYFLITFAILSLLKYIQRRLAPKRVTVKEAAK